MSNTSWFGRKRFGRKRFGRKRFGRKRFGRKPFQVSPGRNYPAPRGNSRLAGSWSILPANAGIIPGDGLAPSAAPLPCWRIRDHPDPAIRGDSGSGKPGKPGLGSVAEPARPGAASPRLSLGFSCFFFHGRDEPPSCFSWSLEWCLSAPGGAGPGCPAGQNPPAPSAAEPAGPLRAPGGSSGSHNSGPQSEGVLDKHPKIPAAFTVEKLRDFRPNASLSPRQTRVKSLSARSVF